jgi:hypothetical protein
LNGRHREPIAHFLAYWNAQVVLAVVLGLRTSAAVAQDCGFAKGQTLLTHSALVRINVCCSLDSNRFADKSRLAVMGSKAELAN